MNKTDLEIKINDKTYNLDKSFIFSGGEVQIKLSPFMEIPRDNNIKIKTRLLSSDDIMELLLVNDALDRIYPDCNFELYLYYFPYARQDRVCVEGEAFSLEVMCRLINSMGFTKVHVSDVHSSVIKRLLDNIFEREQWQYVIDVIDKFDIPVDDLLFVAPDAGAVHKMEHICRWYRKNQINAKKIRDPDTGNIIETTVDVDDFKGQDILICDDIADGGMTFYYLSKLLKAKNCGKIYLYITHAIFPNGPDKLYEFIDEIYTTDSIYSGADPRINIL